MKTAFLNKHKLVIHWQRPSTSPNLCIHLHYAYYFKHKHWCYCDFFFLSCVNCNLHLCSHTHTVLHVMSASLILSSCFFGGRRVNSGGAERNNSRSALSRCPGVTSLTGSAGAVASPPLCGVRVWINPTESERSYYLSSVVSASLLVNLRSS